MTISSSSFDENLVFDFDPGEPGDDQRWTTWPAALASERGPQPWPEWLVTTSAAFDTELGILKTGKEAEVYLIERADIRHATTEAPRCLLAAKRYLRHERSSFHRSGLYREGRRTDRGKGATREDRATEKGTSFGRAVIAAEWAAAEFAALCRLWQRGAPVPYPVQLSDTELLMEFIGADAVAAPRLAQARDADFAELFAQTVEAMRIIAAAGLAHGDLSAYNLLVHEDRIRVIDLPQIIDLAANPRGLDFLHRDCVNVCDWFARRRVECDAEELFAELVAIAFG